MIENWERIPNLSLDVEEVRYIVRKTSWKLKIDLGDFEKFFTFSRTGNIKGFKFIRVNQLKDNWIEVKNPPR